MSKPQRYKKACICGKIEIFNDRENLSEGYFSGDSSDFDDVIAFRQG